MNGDVDKRNCFSKLFSRIFLQNSQREKKRNRQTTLQTTKTDKIEFFFQNKFSPERYRKRDTFDSRETITLVMMVVVVVAMEMLGWHSRFSRWEFSSFFFCSLETKKKKSMIMLLMMRMIVAEQQLRLRQKSKSE